MKYAKKTLALFLLITCIIMTLYDEAYAYLDPGTGSFIFQMALAAVLAAAVTMKLWWKKVIMFISGIFSKSQNQETDDK